MLNHHQSVLIHEKPGILFIWPKIALEAQGSLEHDKSFRPSPPAPSARLKRKRLGTSQRIAIETQYGNMHRQW